MSILHRHIQHVLIYLLYISVFIFFLSACSAPVPSEELTTKTTSSDQIHVTDAYHQTVTLSRPAKRIVVLFEASLDDLYMLGAGHNVVGIPAKIYHSPSLFSAYRLLDTRIAQKQIATPSSWEASTNLESIVALQPDLVLVNSAQRDVIELLKSMHIAVYAVQSESYSQTRKELLDLGELTGTSTRAHELVQFIEQEIQAMQHTTQYPAQQVYYAWSGGRIFSTSGRNSMPNTVMTLAGTENIIKSDVDQPTVNPEHLLEWNPDVILLWNSDPALIYARPELRSLKAVQHRQVFSLNPSFLFNPHTPKILLAANQLHHWVNPSIQSTAHAHQDQQRILSMFYGPIIAEKLLQLAKNT
ncbi:ABC transporter substrate-binding protein [Acinetobacter sp. B5B]|uniref:ABC transporter substrate-binding protein n=1 Tax=Acinetobacter baretiae TaxID=2605383 RepID=UPI0018C34B12|nr:ABC transporter substrate-binding protein [Acinetobacter baretiae]MBF7682571.1 ABC transporter substrate-binding protein [Acinetobacter baretiae]